MSEFLTLFKENIFIITIFTIVITAIVTSIVAKAINSILKERMNKFKDENERLLKALDEKDSDEERVLTQIETLLTLQKKGIYNNERIANKLAEIDNFVHVKLELQPDSYNNNSIVVRSLEGLKYIIRGDLAAAEHFYINLIHKYSNNSEVFRKLGTVYRMQGRHEDALKIFYEALKKNQDRRNTLIYNNIGELFRHMKDFTSAKQWYNKAIHVKGEPNHYKATPYFNLGVLHYQMGKPELEKKYYMEVFKYNPCHTKALYNMSCLFCDEGDLASAIDYFISAFESGPSEISILAEKDEDISPIKDHPEYLSRMANPN